MLKYSKDKRCVFDSTNHSYKIGDKKLIGVTSYISKFKNKFDSLAVATAYVKNHGGNVEELIAKWGEEGKRSMQHGTAVHEVIENYILTGRVEKKNISYKEDVAIKFINDYFISGKLHPVEVEYLVYNEQMGIASMVDCIVKDNEGNFYILDWKTSKKIELNSYGKFMFDIYSEIPDCNYYHYSLQLSLYQQMCTEYNINDKFIVHLDNEDYKIIRAKTI